MTNRQKSVLFTGGGGAGSEALFRLFQPEYAVHFADADIEAKPPSIPSDRWHTIPLAIAPTFVEEIGQLCRRIGVDLLAPTVDEELLPIAGARDSLGCDVLLPDEAFVRTHLDKLSSNQALHASGLPAPRTERLLERTRVGFPCIVKPRRGRGSRGVAIVQSEEELCAHLITSRRDPDELIVQELLEGPEYTVMVSASRTGVLRAIVPVLVEIKRGITLRAQTRRDEDVGAACAAIHDANPVGGCYNVQLVATTEGAKPFEINPRISTTACLALAAGVNFISGFLSEAQATETSDAPWLRFRDHVRLKRSWYNEILG